MLGWLRNHPGPIYTSRAHPDYPGLVEFPLEDVINSCGIAYFNNTAAYAVAYAVHIGVKKITLFGCDYTYPNAHDAEKGRACTEFHLGIAKARGIRIGLTDKTSLMDACCDEQERSTATTRSISGIGRRRRTRARDVHAARDASDRRRNRSPLRPLETSIPAGEGTTP
jgi:hypothetical protein